MRDFMFKTYILLSILSFDYLCLRVSNPQSIPPFLPSPWYEGVKGHRRLWPCSNPS